MKKNSRLLPFLFLLTALFAAIEIGGYLRTERGTFYVLALIKTHAIAVPINIIWAELGFLFIQISLHVIYTLIIWVVARLMAFFFNFTWEATCQLGFGLWLLATLTVLLANQVFYPASGFALLMATLFPSSWAVALFYLGGVGLILSSLFALLGLAKLAWQRHPVWHVLFIAAIVGIGGGAVAWSRQSSITQSNSTAQQPNVIIIGIDSLRNNYTGFGGYKGFEPLTPNVDRLSQHATIFMEATTPLARTFPSWAVMLTGLYPIHNGVRFNLADQTNISVARALPRELQHAGYYTIYSTDERRFSNVSHRFGFDRVVGPPEGANDFVIGTIDDLPLSNVILNTRVGEYLFPFSYANRSAYATYKTQSFNHLIERAVSEAPRNKPLFLAVHFCLPHWPYVWSTQVYDAKMAPAGLYAMGIRQADIQAAQFVKFLKKNHFLDHAVVIILSDHGEALLEPHDKLITKTAYIKGKNSDPIIFKDLTRQGLVAVNGFDTSYGHGTDVLSFVQYHTVLTVQTMGLNKKNQPGKVNQPVSMVDLEPTILGLLHLKIPKTDGWDLSPYIFNLKTPIKPRATFTETGFNADIVSGNNVTMGGLLIVGARIFKILPNDKIVVRSDMMASILKNKQRAVLYQQWELALYPVPGGKQIPVLVDRRTGQWTDDLSTPFARQAPLGVMEAALKRLYGEEIVYPM